MIRCCASTSTLTISEINFSEVFYEVLQVSRDNKIRLPSNMGLYAKTLANLEGVARGFDPEVNLLNQIKPLMADLFRRQLFGESPCRNFTPYCFRPQELIFALCPVK